MKFRLRLRALLMCNSLLALAACTPPAASPVRKAAGPATPATPAPPVQTAPPTAADDARGARLYDNWRSEKELASGFSPDSAKTPELDGTGGPNGNGTLNDEHAKPLENTGHDYRLKNFFGWDLRGAQGVYGSDYQKKSYVLGHNLLTDTRSPAELRLWFASGGSGLPAFGAVLDARDLDDLVAFVVKTRDKELAHPEAIFALQNSAPKGFVLNPGGDAERGQRAFADRCSKCHGDDGRKIVIDDVDSVGTLARSAGYEVWFKIAHGQPGSPMKRQLTEIGGAAQARTVLDLFAALCNRKLFPALATGKDVPDADPRCAAYLR